MIFQMQYRLLNMNKYLKRKVFNFEKGHFKGCKNILVELFSVG